MALNFGRSSRLEDLTSNSTPARKREISTQTFGHYDEGLDVLTQLRTNITQLEDLHGRLRFMMGEVEKLIRKKL